MSEKYKRVSLTSEFCLSSSPCCVENYFSLLDWLYKLLSQKLPAKEQDHYCRARRRNSLFEIYFVFFSVYLFTPTLFSKCMRWSRKEWHFFHLALQCQLCLFFLYCDVLREVWNLHHNTTTFILPSEWNLQIWWTLRNGEWIQRVRRY